MRNHDGVEAVVADIDGTLTEPEDNNLAQSVHHFLTRTPRAPRVITVATGRIHGSLMNMGLTALCSGPIITEGGGRLVDPTTGHTVHAHPVDEDSLIRFAQSVENESVHLQYACYAKNGLLPYTFFLAPGESVPRRYSAGARVFTDIRAFIEAAARDKACKINFRIQRGSTPLVGDNIAWNTTSADVLAHGVNKASALRELADHLGITLQKVLFAGNDDNDLPAFMLQGPMKIFVGGRFQDTLLQKLGIHARVPTPEDLGLILASLFPV